MITINEYVIKVTMFPDNTSQVWKLPDSILKSNKGIDIVWDFENESEIFHLCQLVDLLKMNKSRLGVMSLHIDYLPYGRQDKDISNYETFALRSFAKIINSLEFDYISTKDAHSSVAKIINNIDDIFPVEEIKHAINQIENPILAYPDHGAYLRYSIEFCKFDKESLIGTKKRNQQTGYIEEYNIEGVCQDRNVVIIDDICDGGMTFRLLSKELLKRGAKSVTLYVTHGIFSKGLDVLKRDGISRIFTQRGEL